MMYKLLVVCFAMIDLKIAYAVTPDQKAMIQSKLLAGGLECIRTHPLSLSEIKSLKNKMLPDKENARCFAACLFRKIGLMDDMGKLDTKNIQAQAQQIFKDSEEHVQKTEQLVKECSKVNDHSVSDGDKGCDRAQLAFSCLTDAAPKYGFDIDF